MAAGGKCKYLLYVSSAGALINCRRRAANFVRAKKVITSLNNRTQQGQGALAVFRRQEVHVGTARHGYHVYKNRVLNQS